MREVKPARQPWTARLSSTVDSIVGIVSPKAQVQRQFYRAVAGRRQRGYDGAGRTVGLKNFCPYPGSADNDLDQWDLDKLRSRSRHMERNNPIAHGTLQTDVDHVIGPGLRYNSRIDGDALGWSPKQVEEAQATLERGFRIWCYSADLEGTETFGGLQRLAYRAMMISGDCLVLITHKKNPWDVFGTKLQIIEGDRLSNPRHLQDTDRLVQGVELDAVGQPIAYHVMTQHPGDLKAAGKQEWIRYPARTKSGRRAVLHLHNKARPGQHRGVPYLAPIIEILDQMGEYTKTEMHAAHMAGKFTAFRSMETDLPPTMGPIADETSTQSGEPNMVELDNGLLVDIGPDENVAFTTPGRPNSQFDPFMLAMFRMVGMGVGQPVEVVIKHFQSSYSAARAAILMAFQRWLCDRSDFVDDLCNPVLGAVVEEMVAINYIQAPGFRNPRLRDAYLGAEWIGPKRMQIDETKEVQAAKGRLNLTLTTLAEECQAMTGTDWGQKIATLRQEAETTKTIKRVPLPEINGGTANPTSANENVRNAGPPGPGGPGIEDDPDERDREERREMEDS